MPTTQFEIRALTNLRVLVWHVVCDGAVNQQNPDIDVYDVLQQVAKTHPLGENLLFCDFRGVSLDRLDSILKYGVDVLPTDQPIYVADSDKALAYGEWPKLLMFFHPDQLQPTWREVPATLDPVELTEMRKTYPTQFVSNDGSKLWLSRFSPDAPQVGTDYEVAYGKYIAGNPFDALAGVLVLAPASWQL
ncbi:MULTISPECIES: hypothetical protein [Pseudomonas]|uniref:hypothetical protein n=1 Tax=Pseudomonas TaxID=286 RepID=UPI0020065CE6|nr:MULTISPECIES: hypothetical protein [Pseudomonas]MCK6250510.1 hypothetical protein [Pseudomonas fragi]